MGLCETSNVIDSKQGNNSNYIDKTTTSASSHLMHPTSSDDIPVESIEYINENNNNSYSQNPLEVNNEIIFSDTDKEVEDIFEKINLLGNGPFGEVWLVKHKKLEKQFAMKIINKKPIHDINKVKDLITDLNKLEDKYLLKILQTHITSNKTYIITDYCEEGSLNHKILEKKIFTEEELNSFYLYRALKGIKYLHVSGLYHNNIKPENIMIINGKIKLIDFWMFLLFPEEDNNITLGNSLIYKSPEELKGNYSETSDLWSFGIIMYTMLMGIVPFKEKNIQELLKLEEMGQYDTNSEGYLKLSKSAKKLIRKLLVFNPAQRIKAREAINHNWFLFKSYESIHI